MNAGRREIPVIAIDGPSGSGKGTVSRLLARELEFHFLDSGALYRLLALAADRRGVELDDEKKLADLALELDIEFPSAADDERVMLDGEDVSRLIRSESVGNGASRVAVLPGVRNALLDMQRSFARLPGLVADGRDMGTVVFPGATAKLFLTASSEERAKRRCKQLKENNINSDYDNVLAEILARDMRDIERAVAPLRAAADAEIVDTTGLEIPRVLAHVVRFVKNQLYQ